MGRDKATLSFRGATLIEHVVSVVRERCAPVFVVAAPGQGLPPLEAEILRDHIRRLGPLVATGRGLRAAADAGAEVAFVSAVDMPFLDASLIDVLADSADRVSADIVLPWDGRDHYLAALYRTSLIPVIDELVAAGERSMSALVNHVDAQRIVLPDSRVLTNVNSAVDLPSGPRESRISPIQH